MVDGVEALGTLVARLDASVFEATTALALDHFARERVDVAVLEVGLGGRYDATTVGRPAVTVLTPIDLDHQEYLGTTLAEIAARQGAHRPRRHRDLRRPGARGGGAHRRARRAAPRSRCWWRAAT